MKKMLSLLLIAPCASVNAYTIDCANIKELYHKAEELLDSDRPSYKSHAVDIFKALYDQCKDRSTDHTTMGLTTFQIGSAHWHGYGVERHYPKACSYFDEVLQRYPDVTENQIVPWSHYYIADGARNELCETRNWVKAVILYQKILDNLNATDPNVRAWAQARLADSYKDGQGVEQSDAKSVELFTAILNNDKNIQDKSVVAWAKFWIADAHEFGKSVEKDIARARELFTDIVENYKTLDPIAVLHAQERLQKMEHVGNS